MKSFISIIMLVLGSYIFSMNSMENRQLLVEDSLSSINSSIQKLKDEADSGNNLSLISYKIYLNMLREKSYYEVRNKDIQNKLIEVGLCMMNGNRLVLAEYYISDEIPRLTRTHKFIR